MQIQILCVALFILTGATMRPHRRFPRRMLDANTMRAHRRFRRRMPGISADTCGSENPEITEMITKSELESIFKKLPEDVTEEALTIYYKNKDKLEEEEDICDKQRVAVLLLQDYCKTGKLEKTKRSTCIDHIASISGEHLKKHAGAEFPHHVDDIMDGLIASEFTDEEFQNLALWFKNNADMILCRRFYNNTEAHKFIKYTANSQLCENCQKQHTKNNSYEVIFSHPEVAAPFSDNEEVSRYVPLQTLTLDILPEDLVRCLPGQIAMLKEEKAVHVDCGLDYMRYGERVKILEAEERGYIKVEQLDGGAKFFVDLSELILPHMVTMDDFYAAFSGDVGVYKAFQEYHKDRNEGIVYESYKICKEAFIALQRCHALKQETLYRPALKDGEFDWSKINTENIKQIVLTESESEKKSLSMVDQTLKWYENNKHNLLCEKCPKYSSQINKNDAFRACEFTAIGQPVCSACMKANNQ